MNPTVIFTTVVLGTIAAGCSPAAPPPGTPISSPEAGSAETAATETRYTQQTAPNMEGTGRFYMGREIAYVMGHQGAGWLERSTREREERTDLLVANLPLESDDVIADLGAGSGYFSRRMAARVPDGKVLAVDLQPQMIELLQQNAAAAGITNIEPVQAAEDNPNLPAASVDLVLLVDAYHEFVYPYEVMSAVAASLKPGGKVVLIEYRAEDPTVPIRKLHKMTEQQSVLEMQAVGLEWVETLDTLPQQHFMIFQKTAS